VAARRYRRKADESAIACESAPLRLLQRDLAYSGAPRSMKMGTIRSLCPYDAAARDALQSANLRRPAILRYASWAAVFPISQGWSGYPSIAAIMIDPDIAVMCQ
jgi:hypothetical protein